MDAYIACFKLILTMTCDRTNRTFDVSLQMNNERVKNESFCTRSSQS